MKQKEKRSPQRAIRRRDGHSFRHDLGQNFIEDEGLLSKLAELSLAGPEDTVLEIGPGAGGLTRHLADRCAKLVAVEVDRTLIPFLNIALQEKKNVVLLCGDALQVDLQHLVQEHMEEGGKLRIAANIPYYLTSELLERFLTQLPQAESLCLMVQKEVADKLAALPGEEGYGPLPIRCQVRYQVEQALEVPAACFTPPPKVDSCFVRLLRRGCPQVPEDLQKEFDHLVHQMFLLRRKTVLNNLISGMGLPREAAKGLLEKLGLDEKVRPERLSIQEYLEILQALRALQGHGNGNAETGSPGENA